jgi:pimeloyl-ACP methyl ester carboxylesterase
LLADAYSLAVADADTFFQVEVPALLDWLSITKDDLRKIHLAQPTLSMLGAESDAVWPGFQETHEFLLSWLPQVEAFDLPRATHAMHMMNPHDAAEGLTEFLIRYPMQIGQK